MEKYSLLIADVHLQPDASHPLNRAFLSFLQTEAPQAEALYILGDLFEMWVGDDLGLTQYAEIVEALKNVHKQGVKLYLQFGNRDFLMRRRFWQASGIQPLKQPHALTLYGHHLLLLHGDSLCTDDKAYQKMRRILRNPLVMGVFLRLPKQKRLQIGLNMREKSRRFSANKAENIMDVNLSAVRALLAKYPQTQHLIHGHTHRPAHHIVEVNGQPKHRWVLGDWQTQAPHSQILKVSQDGIALLPFSARV